MLLGAADGYNYMMYPTIAELLDLVSRLQAEAVGEVITTGEQFLLDAAIFKLGRVAEDLRERSIAAAALTKSTPQPIRLDLADYEDREDHVAVQVRADSDKE
jgi:hypothetical protein